MKQPEGSEEVIDFNQRSDAWLIAAASRIGQIASERGLVLSFTATDASLDSGHEATNDLLKESLKSQWVSAYRGYKATVKLLNANRKKEDRLPLSKEETMQNELDEWLSDEKVSYVEQAKGNFALVATPNVLVDAKGYITAAKAFGKLQGQAASIPEGFYEWYDAQQLSGTTPLGGQQFVFSLIPLKPDERFSGTVKSQLDLFGALKDEYAFLKVPSPLEVLAYWQTLKELGVSLRGEETIELTYSRSFDLPVIHKKVPGPYINAVGQPEFYPASSQVYGPARIAVG